MTKFLWSVDKKTFSRSMFNPRQFWDKLGHSSYRFWLDSGSAARGARTLFAWGKPLWVFSGKSGRGMVSFSDGRTRTFACAQPADMLRDLLGAPVRAHGFAGGAVGYWGYECAGCFDRIRIQRAKFLSQQKKTPDFMWVMPSYWAVLENDSLTLMRQSKKGSKCGTKDFEQWIRVGDGETGGQGDGGAGRQGEGEMGRWGNDARGRRGDKERGRNSRECLCKNKRDYEKKVQRIKSYIAAGDIYQANLTHQLDFPFESSAVDFFDALKVLNPSPYSALMQFPGFSLASCSPELLLRVRGKHIETRPIAGTRPRGATRQADQNLAGELLLNEKERAEHIMLVDLERNDLGRVCVPGSVQVSERMVLEKYSHVIHIVSHVKGVLSHPHDGFDAVKALFPGGTITGCPKIRCMEILSQLERQPRGPFFGSAGWIGLNGDMDLNILIRTALLKNSKMSLRVGAGIVADSDPQKEYEETLHKAKALIEAYHKIMNR